MLGHDEICSRFDELAAIRRVEEPEWRELAALFRPDQVGIGSAALDGRGETTRQTGYEDLFDSTQLYAIEAFEGGLFSQATNPMMPWFDLGLDDRDLTQWRPVKDWLGAAKRIMYASFAPAASGFYAETPSWFGDTGIFGGSALFSEEDQGGQRFVDRVMPVDQIFIDVDLAGRVNTVFRLWTARGRQAKAWFRDALHGDLAKVEDTKPLQLIHAVFPNPDFRAGMLGPRGKPFASVYLSPDLKNWRRDGGYYELPYHYIQWKRRPGRTYPIGPGHLARPDTAMLQEMERTHITAAQFAAEPPTMVHDESVMTAADIVPNAVLYGTMSDQGKRLMDTLQRGEQVGLSMQQSEQRRAAIKEAFYFSLMQLVNRPQMTATEFLGFQEERLRLMGPNLTRIQTYGLSPLISRRFHMLMRAGQLPPPPEEIRGRMVSVEYISPLAKALKAAEGKATMQWIAEVGQLAQFDPDVLDNVDTDRAAFVLGEALGRPPEVQRDPREVAARRQARAGAVQQQALLDQTQQAVSVAAEAAHAAQATSLAGQRQTPARP